MTTTKKTNSAQADEGVFEHLLETLKQKIPTSEFVSVLLDLLEKQPSPELLDILQAWLEVHGYQDERVVSYWTKILYEDDVWQKERALE